MLLQLQAHLLQFALMTQQLLFLNQAQSTEGGKKEVPQTQPIRCKRTQIEYVKSLTLCKDFIIQEVAHAAALVTSLLSPTISHHKQGQYLTGMDNKMCFQVKASHEDVRMCAPG